MPTPEGGVSPPTPDEMVSLWFLAAAEPVTMETCDDGGHDILTDGGNK